MNPLRVLIVEDQESMRAALREGLLASLVSRFPGCEIQCVTTFAEGLAIVLADPAPSFTILDLGLEDSSTEQTARRVHEFEARSPTIIVTGSREADVRPFMGDCPVLIIHKAPGMISKIVAAILGRSDHLKRADENLAEVKEMLSHGHPA